MRGHGGILARVLHGAVRLGDEVDFADASPRWLRSTFRLAAAAHGRLWHTGEINVTQEHSCTAVLQSIMAHIDQRESILEGPQHEGIAIVSALGGELHEVGARMLADFLRLGR